MLTVILLAVASQSLRNILLDAYDLGMNSGEYAFLAIELIRESSTSSESHGWYKIGDRRNKEAREMFESLLQISSRVPTSIRFTSFVHEVTKRAHNEFAATLKDTDVSYIYFVDCFLSPLLLTITIPRKFFFIFISFLLLARSFSLNFILVPEISIHSYVKRQHAFHLEHSINFVCLFVSLFPCLLTTCFSIPRDANFCDSTFFHVT